MLLCTSWCTRDGRGALVAILLNKFRWHTRHVHVIGHKTLSRYHGFEFCFQFGVFFFSFLRKYKRCRRNSCSNLASIDSCTCAVNCCYSSRSLPSTSTFIICVNYPVKMCWLTCAAFLSWGIVSQTKAWSKWVITDPMFHYCSYLPNASKQYSQ